MKRLSTSNTLSTLGAFALAAASFSGCTSAFPETGRGAHVVVTVTGGDRGTPASPLELSVTTPRSFTVRIEMHRADGSIDSAFNGTLRASVAPGAVQSLEGPNTSARNVRMQDGVAEGVVVNTLGAFGETRIVFEDIGYLPVDPLRTPAPQCSDGIDNDNDGAVDSADPGCAFANDDSEVGGSFAAGTSEVIFFKLPRISDVRDYTKNGIATAFPKQKVVIDTGHRGGKEFAFSTVITRISSDGFYVTDLEGDLSPKRGSSSVFAFTFSPPPRLRVCDRLKTLAGTSLDFFGFTEITFPTWLVEEWDPNVRPCLVPEALTLTPATVASVDALSPLRASFIRVETNATYTAQIAKHFGSNRPEAPGYIPTDDASNCDLNGDAQVDFNNPDERACAGVCDADLDCSEYSTFASRGDFKIKIYETATPTTAAKIQANGSSSPRFDAFKLRGSVIRAFAGTLRYFSGGSQHTIEARCEDDIVEALTNSDNTPTAPKPSDKACVFPRTISDNNESN